MTFQEQLLRWYHEHERILPWREDTNPYRIWLSEIMLQQTQVATVIGYFNRFVAKYPTVQSLAEAEEESVLKLWEGLGYYSRAKRLIPCARMVVDTYGGDFPKNYEDMIKLPGVGSYTAGAVLSIAYNLKYPAVDGNVMRVYARLFNLDWDISLGKTKLLFEEKVMETLPDDRRNFNQALMELGALICTPKDPKCDRCPLRVYCEAEKIGSVLALPVKTKKIKKKHVEKLVLYIVNGEEVLLVKRSEEGLLSGLWGFPAPDFEEPVNECIAYWLKENLDLTYISYRVIKQAKHVFTHLVWDMTFCRVEVSEKSYIEYPEIAWIKPEEIKSYPLPTAFKKLIDL